MPLFSGVPLINVKPQDTRTPSESIVPALALGAQVAQGRQELKLRRESMAEDKRQFDLGSKVRETKQQLDEMKLQQGRNIVEDQRDMAGWLNRRQKDEFEPSPSFRTAAMTEQAMALEKATRANSLSLAGDQAQKLIDGMLGELSKTDPGLFVEAMEERAANGNSEKFLNIVRNIQFEEKPLSSPGREAFDRQNYVADIEAGRTSPEVLRRFDERTTPGTFTTRVITSPDGSTTTEIIKGGRQRAAVDPSDLSPTVRSKLQTSRINRESAIANIDDLYSSIDDSAVGIQGVFTDVIQNRFLSQFGVKINARTASARAKINGVFESILKTLSDDGRFTEKDIERIRRSFASPDFLESGQNARIKISEILKRLGRENVLSRQNEGLPLTADAFKSKWELLAAAELGLITRREASDAYKARRHQSVRPGSQSLEKPVPSLQPTNPPPAGLIDPFK